MRANAAHARRSRPQQESDDEGQAHNAWIWEVNGDAGDIIISLSYWDDDNDLAEFTLEWSTDEENWTKAENVTGPIQAPPGDHQLVWLSAYDFPGNSDNVFLRLSVNDGFATYTDGPWEPIAIHNDHYPQIQDLQISGEYGNMAIAFNLTDLDNDTADLTCQISLDDGVTWQEPANLTGNLTSVAPGYVELFWASALDVPGANPAVRIRVFAADATGTGPIAELGPFLLNNMQLPVITAVTLPDPPRYGNLAITFSLENPAGGVASLSVSYSTDGGQTFSPSAGLESIYNLAAGEHTVTWLSRNNIQLNLDDVRLRLIATGDRGIGPAFITEAFSIKNYNLPPTLTLAAPSGNSGLIRLPFTILDLDGEYLQMTVEYAVEEGGEWRPLTQPLLQPSGNLTFFPSGSYELLWYSDKDFRRDYETVRLRLTPKDKVGPVESQVTGPFPVHNNHPPQVTLSRVVAVNSDVHVDYTLTDVDLQPCDLSLDWRLQDTDPWTPTTRLAGPRTAIKTREFAESRSVVWSSYPEIITNPQTVTLRLTLTDGVGGTTEVISNPFALHNNHAPATSFRAIEGERGDITVRFALDDPEGDTGSVSLEYIANTTGWQWQPVSSVTGALTDLVSNTVHTLVWHSTAEINVNEFSVRLRLKPADSLDAGSYCESAPFSVANNDPAQATVTAITGNSGDITLQVEISDPENDPCMVRLHWSENGKDWHYTDHVSGTLTGLTPGIHEIVWNSAQDCFSDLTGAVVMVVPDDGTGPGTGLVSTPFALANDRPPAVSFGNISSPTNGGTFTISCNISDPDGQALRLRLEWSADGTTWQEASGTTIVGNGTLRDGLLSFTWNSAADYPNGYTGTGRLRLTVNDGYRDSQPAISNPFTVDNRNCPRAVFLSVSQAAGDVIVSFRLDSTTNATMAVSLFAITDNLSEPLPLAALEGPLSNLQAGDQALIWHSREEFHQDHPAVQIKIVPTDAGGTGLTALSTPFALDNNRPPVLSGLEILDGSGEIRLRFGLNDADGHMSSVRLAWSSDDGATFHETDHLLDPTTGLAGGTHEIRWDSNRDISGNSDFSRLRLIAADSWDESTPLASPRFALTNNSGPTTSFGSVYPDGSAFIVHYNLQDEESDTLSVDLYYSLDGTAWVPAVGVSGDLYGLTSGDHSLRWQNTEDLRTDVSGVSLRLLPFDGQAFGPAVVHESTVDVTNNLPPQTLIETVHINNVNHDAEFSYSVSDYASDTFSVSLAFSLDEGINWTDSSQLAGELNGLAVGSHNLTWHSFADIQGDHDNVTIRLTLTDQFGATGSTDYVFSVLRNSNPPEVTDVIVTGTDGDIAVSALLALPDGRPADLSLDYSLDNGYSFTRTTAVGGNTVNQTAGPVSLTWHSRDDVPDHAPYVMLRVNANDTIREGFALSESFVLDNNQLPTIDSLAVTPAGTDAVSLDFIYRDPENQPGSVRVQVSFDGGAFWNSCRTFDATTENLVSGAPVHLNWSYLNDTSDAGDAVLLRLLPHDGRAQGQAVLSAPFALNANHPPAITRLVTAGGGSTITLIYDLADEDGQACTILTEWSTDGVNFRPAGTVSGDQRNVRPGEGRRLEWDSRADLPDGADAVTLRLSANDGRTTGEAILAAPFAVTNQGLPRVSAVQVLGDTGTVEVSFSLQDAQNDSCSVWLFFSPDGGTSWHRTDVRAEDLAPGDGHTLTWRSQLYISQNTDNLQVKVLPNDGRADGIAGVSAPFSLNNFDPAYYYGSEIVDPTVSSAYGYGDIKLDYLLSGEVGIRYDLRLEFTVDNGATWKPVSDVNGAVSDLAVGPQTLTWRSGMDISGSTTTAVRLTPYLKLDCGGYSEEQTGIAATTEAFRVTNDSLPVASILATEVLEEPWVQVTYTIEGQCTWEIDLYTISGDGQPVQVPADRVRGTTAGRAIGLQEFSCEVRLDAVDHEDLTIALAPFKISSRIKGKLVKARKANYNFNEPPRVKITGMFGKNGEFLSDQNPGTGEITVKFKLIDFNNDPGEIQAVWVPVAHANIFGYYGDDYNEIPGNHFDRKVFIGGLYPQLPMPFTSGTDEASAPEHTIVWKSQLDFQQNYPTMGLRFQARDGSPLKKWGATSWWKANVRNNTNPLIRNLELLGTDGVKLIRRTVLHKSPRLSFSLDLLDAGTRSCDLFGDVSADGGLTWKRFYSENYVKPGLDLDGTEIWNPVLSLPGVNTDEVYLRFTAVDSGGYLGQSKIGPYTVINNEAPSVTVGAPKGIAGRQVELTFTVVDPERDTCSVEIRLSEDGGATWPIVVHGWNEPDFNPDELVGGTTYTVHWKTYKDYMKTHNVHLRFLPTQTVDTGGKPAKLTGPATVVGPIDVQNGADGKVVVCDGGQIGIVNAGGGDVKPLTTGARPFIGLGSNYVHYDDTPEPDSSIWRLPAAGGTPQLLYSGGKNIGPRCDRSGGYWICAAKRLQPDGNLAGSPYGDLYHEGTNLTYNVDNDPQMKRHGGGSLSPDGKSFLYVSTKNGSLTTRLVDIATHKTIGPTWPGYLGQGAVLAQYPVNLDPSFTPDGRSILTVKNGQIVSYPLNGGPEVQLTHFASKVGNGQMMQPFFSLDMKQLFFSAQFTPHRYYGGSNYWAVYRVLVDVDDCPPMYVARGYGSSIAKGEATPPADVPPGVTIKKIQQLDAEAPGAGRLVRIIYDLGDVNEDACDLKLSWRAAGSYQWQTSETVFQYPEDANKNLGQDLSLYWKIWEDHPANGKVYLRLVPIQRKNGKEGPPSTSAAIWLEGDRQPGAFFTEIPTVHKKDMVFKFKVEDLDRDTCSVRLEYDLHDGLGYRPAKKVTGEVKLIPGDKSIHEICWKSLEDFATNQTNVSIRLIPRDGSRNEFDEVMDGFAANHYLGDVFNYNQLPRITSLEPVLGKYKDDKYCYDILFKYVLDDPEGDPCTLKVLVDYNDGSGEVYTNNFTTYESTTETYLVWHSYNDLQCERMVKMRLIPNDGRVDDGYDNKTVFENRSKDVDLPVNNENHAPEIVVPIAVYRDGRVYLEYDVFDPDPNDDEDLSIRASFDGGKTWVNATEYDGEWQDVSPIRALLRDVLDFLRKIIASNSEFNEFFPLVNMYAQEGFFDNLQNWRDLLKYFGDNVTSTPVKPRKMDAFIGWELNRTIILETSARDKKGSVGTKRKEIEPAICRIKFEVFDLTHKSAPIPEKEKISPGAYIHWNIDDDDAKGQGDGVIDKNSGKLKHPGADYRQGAGEGSAKEDDLVKLAFKTSGTLPKKGLLTFEHGSGISIWTDSIKSSLMKNTYNLYKTDDYNQLVKILANDVYVEGESQIRPAILTINYTYPNGSCEFDRVRYTMFAEDTGRQPAAIGGYTEGPDSKGYDSERLFLEHKKLVDCEYSITGEQTWDSPQNCFGWTLGYPGVKDPDSNHDGKVDVDELDALYTSWFYGYTRHDFSELNTLLATSFSKMTIVYEFSYLDDTTNTYFRNLVHAVVFKNRVIVGGKQMIIVEGKLDGISPRICHVCEQLDVGVPRYIYIQ